MCTAVTYLTKDFYFGRTLDYEFSYDAEVTVTPRGYPFAFRCMPPVPKHYALLGMAYVVEGYPLYYDAVNEAGLCMAGLNFVGNAAYRAPEEGKDNLAPYELIPWFLGQCDSVAQARTLLARLNVAALPFREDLPLAQLHWLLADRHEAVTVEAVAEGLRVYENPAGILTNNPPFDAQMLHLNDFMHLSAKAPENRFAPSLPLQAYSRGMGALGLPGDLSSQSRFVRAAFTKLNSVSGVTEQESVSQMFHILGTVAQTRGCCDLGGGNYAVTIYTSCCNADRGIYYYTTYDNQQITAVKLHNEPLDGAELVRHPLVKTQRIFRQN